MFARARTPEVAVNARRGRSQDNAHERRIDVSRLSRDLLSAGEIPGRTRMLARLKLSLLLALACGLLLTLAPSGAFAAKRMEVSVQDDFALVSNIPKGAR